MVQKIDLVVLTNYSDHVSFLEIGVCQDETCLLLASLHLQYSHCQLRKLRLQEPRFLREMRGPIAQLEGGGEELIQQKQHFHWVPHVEQEVIFLVHSSLELRFKDVDELRPFEVIEILSEVLEE